MVNDKRLVLIFGLLISMSGLLFFFQNASPTNSFNLNIGVQPKNQELYKNPVSLDGCADPAAFYDEDGTKDFYLACTGGRFPIRVSRDMVNWRPLNQTIINSQSGFANWARSGKSWAPALGKIDRKYVAYYTQNKEESSHYANSYDGRVNIWGAIGVSVTDDIERENFSEPLDRPIVQDDQAGGIIDAGFFYDKGSRQHYLLYKPDSNYIFKDTSIMIRPLRPSGLSFEGPAVMIEQGGKEIEDLIEGPEMIKRNGFYYLFYSSGSWAETSYRVYVVRSKNIYGPYEGKRLVLSGREGGKFEAPGHGSIVRVNGKDYYMYHAWARDRRDLGRLPMIDRIYWYDGWPIVNNGYPSEGVHFKPTTKHSLFHKVIFSWTVPNLVNPVYSLDVVHSNGTRVNACVNARALKNSRTFTFTGRCSSSSASDRIMPSTKSRYRLCAASNGEFGKPNTTICSPFRNIKAAQIKVKWK